MECNSVVRVQLGKGRGSNFRIKLMSSVRQHVKRRKKRRVPVHTKTHLDTLFLEARAQNVDLLLVSRHPGNVTWDCTVIT